MTDRPLISIVTPTIPERRELLQAAFWDVRRQTYPNMEHVIVVDDQSDELHWAWSEMDPPRGERRMTTRRIELGRNWSSVLPDSFGIAPILAGILLARGDYLMWWCDDERAEPHHVARLVDALETTGADFAYSDVLFWRAGTSPEAGYVIGSDPPEMGTITNVLWRVSGFARFGMPAFGTHPVDWALVKTWMAAGARWAYVPGVTFSHRADH